MPYIKKDLRRNLNVPIMVVMNCVEDLPRNFRDGTINYIFTCFMNYFFAGGAEEVNYSVLQRGMGLLTSVMDEYKDQVVRPYEKKKREDSEHGPVYPKTS